MNLNNLGLTKVKKDLFEFKKKLNEDTNIDIHTLDYCINDVLSMLSSSITNLNRFNTKKVKFLK